MISGFDTIVAGSGPGDEGDFIVSVLRRQWPDLVVQGAEANDAVLPEDPSITHMREFFVYRSCPDFDSWTADGATDANDDTMIHVILGRTSTTLVSGGPGSTTYRIATELRREINAHRLVVWARVRSR